MNIITIFVCYIQHYIAFNITNMELLTFYLNLVEVQGFEPWLPKFD